MVEATASAATSASAPTEQAGKPTAPATAALQLGPAPPESRQRNHGILEGAFGSFVAITTAPSAASSSSDETVLTIMVDSGASHKFVDPFLTPRLEEFMSNYRVQSVPQNIVGIGEHMFRGDATGIAQGTVPDDGGHKRQFSSDAVVVSGMGSNLFSVTTAI